MAALKTRTSGDRYARLGLGDLPLKRRLSWLEWQRRHLRESLFSNARAPQYEEYMEEVASYMR
jgi:hypothetical protein